MIENTLLESFQSSDNSTINIFIEYINCLEGIKSKIKNLHWAASKLPSKDKRGAHLYLDALLENVIEVQDSIAEQCQGALGIMNLDAINPHAVIATSTSQLMKYIESETISFYKRLPQSPKFIGIKAELETFIGTIEKYIYLFQLTD